MTHRIVAWFIALTAGLCLAGCEGPAGRAGAPGEPGGAGEACTVADNGDGTFTITCGDEVIVVSDGEDGTNGNDGEDGDDGEDGQDGEDGEDGPPGPSAADVFDVRADVPARLILTVDAVGMSSPPVVEFRVTDGIGRGAVGLAAGPAGQLRFGLARLVPAAGGEPSRWVSYVNRLASGSVAQATTERTGTLVDHRDGRYTYTFLFDPVSVANPATGEPIGYDATHMHRLAVQLSGSIDGVALPAVNATHDFVPGGGAIVGREIAATASCNECHDELRAHGSRFELKYCVVCHNPGTREAGTGASADMTTMVHKIHMGPYLPSGAGYTLGGHDYGEVTYPQLQTNCRKCHDGNDAATPQGDNWRTVPSAEACGSCHDLTDFANNVNHSPAAGSQPDNARCALCHGPADIEAAHADVDATPNNPTVASWLSTIRYELLSATVDAGNHPVVEFRILRDGVAMDLSGTTLPTGIVNGPSFLFAYAHADGGPDWPIDYDNLGRSSAQPVSVSLANLRAGGSGTLTPSASNPGAYVATVSWAFPEGATMRAVSLQGYFSQTSENGGQPRHVASVTRSFAGDAARRLVADGQKCAACHEALEAHGGNRNIVLGDPASASGEQLICTVCHVPNLSTSGRSHTNANNLSMIEPFCASTGCDPQDPLTFPEDSNNFRDMVHGIHASAVRTEPYRFVRSRGMSGIFAYDWSEVTFPAGVGNCNLCHLPGTYYPPEGAAPTTVLTSDGTDETPEAVAQARNTLPNATDLVISPAASSCYYCHDSAAAVGHMSQNGAAFRWTRQRYLETPPVESCNVCHGPGRTFDVEALHGLE